MAGVQLRYASGLTSDDYISQEAWREATLECCPLHPQGGCSFRRHTPYERKDPPGARVARWYCREGHCTFSLLPDCLAARLPGTLVELEAVVALAEQAPSLEAAANDARTDDIGLIGAMRWVRRRRDAVHTNLTALKGLMPERRRWVTASGDPVLERDSSMDEILWHRRESRRQQRTPTSSSSPGSLQSTQKTSANRRSTEGNGNRANASFCPISVH